MADLSDLPHLIALLDDESWVVRSALRREFLAHGPRLRDRLEALDRPPTVEQWEVIEMILSDARTAHLVDHWRDWFPLEDEYAKLEEALTLIANFMTPPEKHLELSPLLDKLAAAYRRRYTECDPYALANFLFREHWLHGAAEDYYNPANSNLIEVIAKGQGLPISLACIYMLVGNRLGLHIEGCLFPNHFLARYYVRRHVHLVDCFNGGQIINDSALQGLNSGSQAVTRAEPLLRIIHGHVSVESIVLRVLSNLIFAYGRDGNTERMHLFADLRRELEQEVAAHST